MNHFEERYGQFGQAVTGYFLGHRADVALPAVGVDDDDDVAGIADQQAELVFAGLQVGAALAQRCPQPAVPGPDG